MKCYFRKNQYLSRFLLHPLRVGIAANFWPIMPSLSHARQLPSLPGHPFHRSAPGHNRLRRRCRLGVRREAFAVHVATLSLARSTSQSLNAGNNKLIAANFEIGYDLFVPLDKPRPKPKQSHWQQFCSFVCNVRYGG